MILGPDGKPIMAESNEHLDLLIQTSVESKVNTAQFQLEKEAKSYYRYWGAIYFIIIAGFMVFEMFYGIAKLEEWTEKYVNKKMNEPTLEEAANKIMQNRMAQYIDNKMSEVTNRISVLDQGLQYFEKLLDPRVIPSEFINILKDKPKGIATIIYPKEDAEAYFFAGQLAGALSAAGWIIEGLEPINLTKHSKFSPIDDHTLSATPTITAVGGQSSGISIVANRVPSHTGPGAFNTLSDAFLGSGFGVGGGLNKNVPDNVLWIIVGPKL
jgi:hypothetical protein